MATIPTRTVRVKATGTTAVINVSDFDPKLHEDPNVPKPESPTPLRAVSEDPGSEPTALSRKRSTSKG